MRRKFGWSQSQDCLTPTTITTTTGQNLTFDLPCGSPPSVKSSTWTTSPHCRIESFRVSEWLCVNKSSFLCQTKNCATKTSRRKQHFTQTVSNPRAKTSTEWRIFFHYVSIMIFRLPKVLQGLPGHRVWPRVCWIPESTVLWGFSLFSFQRVTFRMWNGWVWL